MVKEKARSVSRRTDSKKTASGGQKVVFKGYVNWTLGQKHREAFEAWLKAGIDVDDLVSLLLDSGHTLKFRFDSYNQCLAAQIYCEDASNPNAGYALSMRASEWYKALERVLYVHFIAFDCVWVISEEGAWSDERW